MTNNIIKSSLFVLFALGVFSGCGQKQAAAPMQMPPPEVGVITVSAHTVPITSELPGRIDPERIADVRARVTGIVLKRLFTEGADVQANDQLFQIDPAPFQAALDSANASLAHAQAELKEAHSKAERYKALVAINAVSKQDDDDASATALQAIADVEAGKASVETAQLNLGYAAVTAPISGKIGVAKVTEGALVNQADATEMATIQQMDPIYFDFTESSSDLLHLKSLFDKGNLVKLSDDEAKVTLVLEDGSTYKLPGKLLFRDVTVDPSTGMVSLRSEFPNPDHTLLPGMFARVQFEQAVKENAINVLQRAVALKGDGTATIMVVGADNIVNPRTVTLGDASGDEWVITDGLKAGETVVVDGLQKVKPGAAVKPVPFDDESSK